MRTLRLDDLRKLGRHSLPELLLLVEASLWLGLMRAAILVFRFQQIAGWLGLSLNSQNAAPTQPQNQLAGQVGWAVRAVAPRTLWESACLAQALACARMLNRRHIPGLLHLGVALGLAPDKPFAAHAWLTCGDQILVGAGGHERFQIIATFGLQN